MQNPGSGASSMKSVRLTQILFYNLCLIYMAVERPVSVLTKILIFCSQFSPLSMILDELESEF
jgi:hypothetical protein